MYHRPGVYFCLKSNHMRKLLLFVCVVASIALSSCSDDDNNAAPRLSKVTATINGTNYAFDYVTVDRLEFTDYNDLNIVATTEADPNDWIEFNCTEYATGTDITYFFAYYIDEVWYKQQPDLTVNVTVNNEDKLEGTFSGTFEHYDESINETITITNGTFEIFR